MSAGIGSYGGPDDDGVGMAAWKMSHRLDDAREAHCTATRDAALSPVVRALLDRLQAARS